MRTGEVIALLCEHASKEDDLLMAKNICCIDVFDDHIEIFFIDGNTEDYAIYKTENVENYE